MINARNNIWETNSSATHSIIMCMAEDYNKLEHGEIMIGGYHLDNETFVTKEAAMNKLYEFYNDDPISFENEYGVTSFEQIEDDDELANEILAQEEIAYTLENYSGHYCEDFVESFTTPNGEVVYAFGYYGGY